MPARSPMPLIANSTWRAPPGTAARLLATARPRSSWQCALKTRLVGVGHAPDDLGEEFVGLVRRRVADRVGQIDRRGAGVDGRLDDAAQEIVVAARRVLRRKFDIVGELPGAADAVDDGRQAGLARDAQLALEMQVGRGEERVDAAARGRRQGAGGLVDVQRAASGQGGDHRPADLFGDLRDGLGVGRRGDGEAGLDDVHAERVQGARHLHLRRDLEREARGLLAVPQGGIEDHDPCGFSSHGPECARSAD